MQPDAHRFDVEPTAGAHFAWIRTRLAVERTLMSWIRTATALIGFGFTIVQFFETFQHMAGVAEPRYPEAPRLMGLLLIGTGLLAMCVALWDYRWIVGYLWSREYASVAGVDRRRYTPLLGVAFLILAIGLFTFISVLARSR